MSSFSVVSVYRIFLWGLLILAVLIMFAAWNSAWEFARAGSVVKMILALLVGVISTNFTSTLIWALMSERKKMSSEWYGVDFDGTLAYYDGWKGPEHLGEPIPLMLARVKGWLKNGKRVKIFTARVSGDEKERQTELLEDWCRKHLGQKLEITATKDFGMIRLYDDRAVQVKENTGILIKG